MKIASLFTGVGGAERGFSAAFGTENVEHVAFAEYDKYASAVLAARFPGVPNFGDVTKIDWAAFPKSDILHSAVGQPEILRNGQRGLRERHRGRSIDGTKDNDMTEEITLTKSDENYLSQRYISDYAHIDAHPALAIRI